MKRRRRSSTKNRCKPYRRKKRPAQHRFGEFIIPKGARIVGVSEWEPEYLREELKSGDLE